MLALYGIGAPLVLMWTVLRLRRAPKDRALWSLCGLITGWTLAFPFGRAADAGAGLLGTTPMGSRLVEHSLDIVSMHGLICFYLYSALEEREAGRRARLYGVPLALTFIVLVAATLSTPGGVGTRDHRVTSVAVFYVAADAYLVFAFSKAWFWNRCYARGAGPRLRRGLRIAATGMIAFALANSLYIVAVVLHWAGGDDVSSNLDTAGAASTSLGWFAAVFLMLPGVVLFLVGVTYPAAAMRVIALRVWWRHLLHYRRLKPLWAALHELFPENVLPRVPMSAWRNALNPRSVHRRYYRRAIECRDGLVRISPYINPSQTGASGDTTSGAELSDRLRHALRAHGSGELSSAHAVAVAVPPDPSLEADVRELIVLADALRTVDPNGEL
ncbi:MAB_1171c family putative transporter [Streptomyces sp. NPDC102364]|uniref:MAB_1171c family putative transporter n=1 Tax=Streptomyces sp. NPDC102364 TaxID=3366161 RepID=UPI0037F8B94F